MHDAEVSRKQLRVAGQKVVAWTAERDRLIREARAAGRSLREIGGLVGLSHTAVNFIAHGRPGQKDWVDDHYDDVILDGQ